MPKIEPIIDERCTQLGLTVDPPSDTTRLHWELSHLWLTINGNWDDVPDWAHQFQNDHLGGDHHVYCLGFLRSGARAPQEKLFMLGWPGDHVFFNPKPEHEWYGNVPIDAGFDVAQGHKGSYYGQINAISTSIVRGMGLPYPYYPWDAPASTNGHGEPETVGVDSAGMIPITRFENVATKDVWALGGLHTSYFLVFQEVDPYEPEPEPQGCMARLACAWRCLKGQTE